MEKKTEAKKVRRPYHKPRLENVPLRPEEAVLGFCKVAGGDGPGGTCGFTCYNAGT